MARQTMTEEFHAAERYVAAVRKENKRHAEALERAEANHARRMLEIDKEAALSPEARALAENVLRPAVRPPPEPETDQQRDPNPPEPPAPARRR